MSGFCTCNSTNAVYTLEEFTNDLLAASGENSATALHGFAKRFTRDFDPAWSSLRLNAPPPGMTYSRTLIFHSPNVEALILAWPPGAESPIHDHPANGCVLKVLRGALIQYVYAAPDSPSARPAYQLMHLLSQGAVGTMAGRNGIHRIVNAAKETTFSVHVYAPSDFYNLNVTGDKRHVWPA